MKSLFILFFVAFIMTSCGQNNNTSSDAFYLSIKNNNIKGAEDAFNNLTLNEPYFLLTNLRKALLFATKGNADSTAEYLEIVSNSDYNLVNSTILESQVKSGKKVPILDSVFSEALRIYNTIVEKQPSDNSYNARGIFKLNFGNYDAAIADFTNSIKLNPKYGSAHYNRALAHDNKNELDLAISDYSKCIVLDTMILAAYLNRGYAYIIKKESEKAIKDLTHVLSRSTNKDQLALAHNNMSEAYTLLKNYDAAWVNLEKSLALDSSNPYTYRNKALIEIAQNKITEACNDINTAIQLGFVSKFGDEINILKNKYCK